MRALVSENAGKVQRDPKRESVQTTALPGHAVSKTGTAKSTNIGKGKAAYQTSCINKDSEFLSVKTDDELKDLAETRFGCTITNGFNKMPMDVKKPLMADLESVYSDFPEARKGLRRIGASFNMDELEAIKVIPDDTLGGYTMVFNANMMNNIGTIGGGYAASALKGNQVSGTSWPSTAYHEGFHGVECYLDAKRFGGTTEFYDAWSRGEVAEEIVSAAYSRYRETTDDPIDIGSMIESISGYAVTSRSETICEAAKDCKVNGPNAKILSSLIVDEVRRLIHGVG